MAPREAADDFLQLLCKPHFKEPGRVEGGGRRAEGRGQDGLREGLPPVSSQLQPPSPAPHFSHAVGVCLAFSLSDNFILSNNDLEILGLICFLQICVE